MRKLKTFFEKGKLLIKGSKKIPKRFYEEILNACENYTFLNTHNIDGWEKLNGLRNPFYKYELNNQYRILCTPWKEFIVMEHTDYECKIKIFKKQGY
ncbi:MAG: hypothetical protein FWF51_06985 [Chitinivibrionia bacterium]|nr:hypothetical protein [Chitinivibrionia bacterium]